MMAWTETRSLIVSIISVGVAIVAVMVLYGNGIHTSIESLRAEAAADRAEAAADRRAHQEAMITFRQEMQRLAERQSRVEGQLQPTQPVIVDVPRQSESDSAG